MSTAFTLKPAASTCFTQSLQHPHVGVLYTVIGGSGAPAPNAAAPRAARPTTAMPTVASVNEPRNSRLSISPPDVMVLASRRRPAGKSGQRRYDEQRPLWPLVPRWAILVPLPGGVRVATAAPTINRHGRNAHAHRQVGVGAARANRRPFTKRTRGVHRELHDGRGVG